MIFFAPWAIRAYVAVAAVAFAAPIVGSFLVQRRLALIGDGIGHLAFAGVAIGVAVSIAPVWGALVAAVLGAVALERLRATGRIAGDIALALVFYGGLATGVVLLSATHRFDLSAIGVLFGNVFTSSWNDVITIVVLCGVVVATIVPFYRQLLAVALDEETARAAGLPVDALNLLTVALTALLVTAGMRVVGLLLIASLLVIPVAAGSRLAHSFRDTVTWAVVVGVTSGLGGLVIALAPPGDISPGGAIVLTSIAAFVVASVTGRRAARRHPRTAS
jgi:zinc transport system permease protein